MTRYGTQMTLDRPWGELASVPGYARQLEEWGYDHIWCPDERFQRNPYAVLTFAARATEGVKLGVSVTNPYTRHPLITGVAVATVNEASGGRAVLGLGAGASALFERQGIKRPSAPVTALREAVEILRPFMRGERVDYGGRTHSFTGANIDFESRPVPIYIAARGPKLFRLAGEIADGVIIGSLTSEGGLKYALDNVRLGLERSDRGFSEFEVVLWAYTSIREDRAEARGRVRQLVVSSMWSSRRIIGHLGLDEDYWRTLEEGMSMGFRRGLPPDQIYSTAAVKLSPELIDAWSLAGDVENVAVRVRAAQDAGVDQIAVLALGDSRKDRMETQRAFAEGIIGRD